MLLHSPLRSPVEAPYQVVIEESVNNGSIYRLGSLEILKNIAADRREQRNAALEDLRCADEWIMAGYSLPSEDVAIRSLLLRAFHARRARATGESASGKELRVRVVLFERDDPWPPNSPADAYRAFAAVGTNRSASN